MHESPVEPPIEDQDQPAADPEAPVPMVPVPMVPAPMVPVGDDTPPPQPASPPAAWWRRWLLMLMLVSTSCAIDQWTKHWAHTSLRRDHGGRIEVVEGYLSMTYVRNPGAAWGFLSRRPSSFRRPFFIAVSVVAIAFILYLYVRLESRQRLLMVALSLVMGGAVGNFIDRLRFNFVIDFIDFYVGRSFKWPTFNVADIAITGGVLILFLDMVVTTVRHRREVAAAAADAAAEPEDAPTPDA